MPDDPRPTDEEPKEPGRVKGILVEELSGEESLGDSGLATLIANTIGAAQVANTVAHRRSGDDRQGRRRR